MVKSFESTSTQSCQGSVFATQSHTRKWLVLWNWKYVRKEKETTFEEETQNLAKDPAVIHTKSVRKFFTRFNCKWRELCVDMNLADENVCIIQFDLMKYTWDFAVVVLVLVFIFVWPPFFPKIKQRELFCFSLYFQMKGGNTQTRWNKIKTFLFA